MWCFATPRHWSPLGLMVLLGVAACGEAGTVLEPPDDVPTPPAPPGLVEVRGHVEDSAMGRPVPGVLVRLGSVQAVADANGEFTAVVQARAVQVSVEADGFDPFSRAVSVSETSGPIGIRLRRKAPYLRQFVQINETQFRATVTDLQPRLFGPLRLGSDTTDAHLVLEGATGTRVIPSDSWDQRDRRNSPDVHIDVSHFRVDAETDGFTRATWVLYDLGGHRAVFVCELTGAFGKVLLCSEER